MGAVVDAVKDMLRSHPEIDTRQTLIVNLNSFGPSSLDFFIYTFTKTTDWVRYHEIKQDVMGQVIQIVHEHGADFAFPTQTINFQDAELEGIVSKAGVDTPLTN